MSSSVSSTGTLVTPPLPTSPALTPPTPPTPPIATPTPLRAAATPAPAGEFPKDDVFKATIIAGPIIAVGVVVIGTAFTIASLARLIFSLQLDTNVHYLNAEHLQKDLEVEQEKEAKLKRDLELADKNLQELSHVPKEAGHPVYFQFAVKIINGCLPSEDEDPELATPEDLAWIRDFKVLLESYKKDLSADPLFLQKAKAHVVAKEFTKKLIHLSKVQQEVVAYQMAKKQLADIFQTEKEELHAKGCAPKEDPLNAWLAEDNARFEEAAKTGDWTTYTASSTSLDDELEERRTKVRFDLSGTPSPKVERARRYSLGAGSDPGPGRLRSRSVTDLSGLGSGVRSLTSEFDAVSEEQYIAEDHLKRSHEEQMAKLEKAHAWELSALRHTPEGMLSFKFHEAELAVETTKRMLAETSHRVRQLTSLLEKCKAYIKAKEELIIYFTSIFYGGTMTVPLAGPSVVMAYDAYKQERTVQKKFLQQQQSMTVQRQQLQHTPPKAITV